MTGAYYYMDVKMAVNISYLNGPDEITSIINQYGSLNINISAGTIPPTTLFNMICRFTHKNNFNLDILKFCLEKGANLNIPDSDNKTALYYYCELIDGELNSNDKLKIVKLLLEYGGNFQIKDNNGTPALSKLFDNTKVIRYIAKNKLIDNELAKNLVSAVDYVAYFKEATVVDESDTDYVIY